MIRPSQRHVMDVQKNSQSNEELFAQLVEDVHCLMTRERKAQEREIEGRSNAMRTLRQLRDWMIDRAGVLTSLHSTFRPLGNPRFKSPYTAYTSTPKMTSQHHTSNQHLILHDQSESIHFPEPKSNEVDSPISQDHVSSIGSKKALLPVPFATSTPRPSESGSREQPVEMQPISTLVEGVNILEKQLREYIHLEILLTDKFRFEMRMKQHQQKAQGFSHKGINEAQSVLGKLSLSKDNADQESIYKLKTQLEQINMEYDQCRNYMDKVISSLTQVDDVDNFMKGLHDREKHYKKDANKPEKKPKGRKVKNGEGIDSYTALVDMLKTHPKSQTLKLAKSNEKLRLPSINKSNEIIANKDDLLTKFKVLVANFEIVRLRMVTIEDRFRRELSRKERKFESIIRSKEDDKYRLQTLLNEAEAEKEKYLRLYNSTKLSTSRKK